MSRPEVDLVRPSGIGEMLISSRSLGEYRAMFALSVADLSRRILDCPGGAASFTAEVNAAGGDATACDPVYAEHSADELATRSMTETDRGNRYVRAHPDQYRWNFFTDPDAHQHSRRAAGVRFATDLRAHPERYVPGRLPHLPFAGASFELVLSSHLLFSYADRLDLTFHHQAIIELMRVTGDELRVFPLVAMGSLAPYPWLDALLTELRTERIIGQIVPVDYEFQAGGNQMLVCRRGERDATAKREDRHVS